jgi:hypothetical protein
LPSSAPLLNSRPFAFGVSITPSMIACATCTPFGPNSRASDCASARALNLPDANEPQSAEPRREAVAPVMSRVGGDGGELETEARRRGRVFWAKL